MNGSSLRALVLPIAGALALAACQGEKGTNGAACTVTNNGDGTATISCADGTSATVSNGTNGTDGTNGTSCTVVSNGDGTRTITCTDGTRVTVSDAVVDYAIATAEERAALNMSLVVTSVAHPDDGRPVVRFKVSDAKGNGVKGLATTTSMRLAILKLVKPDATTGIGVNGSALDTWVSYMAASPTATASTETAGATSLTDNGDGTYTYRFQKVFTNAAAAGTTYEPSSVHRLAIILSASGNPFAPVNVVYDYIPATGETVDPNLNSKVDGAACLECHGRFRAPALGTGKFHGGARYDVRICVACHNDQRRFTTLSATTVDDSAIQADGTWTGNLAIVNGEAFLNLPVYIHKIHMGEDLTLKGGTYVAVSKPYETTFPRDIRNCEKCHRSPAGQADNWKNKPSRRACGACHDDRSFLAAAPNARVHHSGYSLVGELTNDASCSGCHPPVAVTAKHLPVAAPDPNNAYRNPSTGSNNTNAAWLAAVGVVPPGALRITYAMPDTDAVTVDASGHAVVKFKLQKDDLSGTGPVDVVFNAPTAAPAAPAELMDGFVGSPSVYVAFSVPQDGVPTPADFNATVSGYVKSIWNGRATSGTGAGTMAGPDPATGYYTLTLTGVTVPAGAKMLTGGLGYSYSLSSTQPLTQTNRLVGTGDWPFPYCANAAGCSGSDLVYKEGGLIVPAPNVFKVGTGYTARRPVVDSARCNACHGALGASPTFHAGQRNRAETCSFCHNPNRTSSGWSANVKDFVHGIHSAGKRDNPFTWHALSATEGFWEVTYPGVLNSCETCHLPNTYDFSATTSSAVFDDLLWSTAAAGKFDGADTTKNFMFSPYVVTDNVMDYGNAFSAGNLTSGSYNGTACSQASPCVCTPSAPCVASPNTLVTSPITAACVACHDTSLARDHMASMGGSFYAARAEVPRDETGRIVSAEQCLLCHGKGKIAAIADVHR